jgi:hypothetical protein
MHLQPYRAYGLSIRSYMDAEPVERGMQRKGLRCGWKLSYPRSRCLAHEKRGAVEKISWEFADVRSSHVSCDQMILVAGTTMARGILAKGAWPVC